MSMNDIIDQIVTKAVEDKEQFIFSTIQPYCEEIVQQKISKITLTKALLEYHAKHPEEFEKPTPILPHKYRAKDKDSDNWFEGYYFEYPETTYCFEEDYKTHPPKMIPCLAVYRMTDWGLPNIPQMVTIDPSTLKMIPEESDIK